MSRLVFEGDLNKNFGEFLPTPYIDQIKVHDYTFDSGINGYEFIVDYSLLFTVPEHNPSLSNKEFAFIKDTLNKIKINFLFTKSSKDYLLDNLGTISSPGTFKRRVKGFNELMETYKIITGVDFSKAEDPFDELSLLLYDSAVLPVLFQGDSLGARFEDNTGMYFDIVEMDAENIASLLSSGQYRTIYNKKGRKFFKIKSTFTHYLDISESSVDATTGAEYESSVEKPTINLLSFTSILNSDELAKLNIMNNASNNLFFSDVAYEKIITDGDISNQTTESFFDDEGNVYPDTPLQTIGGTYHKTDTTTHEDIYEKFNTLLQSYVSILPPVPSDVQSADPELEGSIEVIQYVLETYKDKIDFLPQIKKSRNQIINRSSGTRTGALYNDMGKILRRANSAVGRGTALTKKLTINAKILDLRERTLTEFRLPTPVMSTLELQDDYINFLFGRTIVFTSDEYSDFNISDLISRELFAGLDISDLTSLGDSGVGRQQTYGQDLRFTYGADGVLVVTYTNPVTGEPAEISVPSSAGFLDDDFSGKKEYNMTNGFVTLDWQSLVQKHSILSTMVDVARFARTFGLGPIKKYFVPFNAKLIKNIPLEISSDETTDGVINLLYSGDGPDAINSPDDPRRTAQTYFNRMSRLVSYTEVPVYIPGTEGEGGINNYIIYGEFSVDDAPEAISLEGQKMYSYMAERAVSYLPFLQLVEDRMDSGTSTDEVAAIYEALSDTLSTDRDRRLMYFEFQNFDQMATYIDYDKLTYDEYKFKAKFLDYTKSALVDVIKHYFFLHFALKNYLEDASLECSYNDIDGTFNDFFAESMRAAFVTNPASSPWIFIPVVYVKHVDFLTNRYGGNETRMLLAAREIIQKISPETGTLEQLQAFYQNYIDLYASYYSQASDIGNMLSSYGPLDSSTDDYAFHHGVILSVESQWHEQNSYSAQNEQERDDFLTHVSQREYQYAAISLQYANQLTALSEQYKEDMMNRFARREEIMAEKMQYEVEKCGLYLGGNQYMNGGCHYVVWWDGWTTTVRMKTGAGIPELKFLNTGDDTGIDFGDGRVGIESANELNRISPGAASGKYGYFWVDPWDLDTCYEEYNVSLYGTPTEFACYIKDWHSDGDTDRPEVSQGQRCRFLKNAYMLMPSQFRNGVNTHVDSENRTGYLNPESDGTNFSEAHHYNYYQGVLVNNFGGWINGETMSNFDAGSYSWTGYEPWLVDDEATLNANINYILMKGDVGMTGAPHRDYGTMGADMTALGADQPSNPGTGMGPAARGAALNAEYRRQLLKIPGFEDIAGYVYYSDWLADYESGNIYGDRANVDPGYEFTSSEDQIADILFDGVNIRIDDEADITSVYGETAMLRDPNPDD